MWWVKEVQCLDKEVRQLRRLVSRLRDAGECYCHVDPINPCEWCIMLYESSVVLGYRVHECPVCRKEDGHAAKCFVQDELREEYGVE